MTTLKEYYNKQYSDKDVFWPKTPEEFVRKYQLLIERDKTVLDLGCGEGRNLKFLRQSGFKNLLGVDFSQAGLDKIKYPEVETVCSDVSEFILNSERKYSCILCNHTAHFIPDKVDFILDIQEATDKKGVNIISAMLKHEGWEEGFRAGELMRLYKDWDILDYREYLGPIEDHDDGTGPHRHLMVEIIARKK